MLTRGLCYQKNENMMEDPLRKPKKIEEAGINTITQSRLEAILE
jgi:hypothetical protein